MTYTYMGNQYTYQTASEFHRNCWDRYWALPDDVIKRHNYHYAYNQWGKNDSTNHYIYIYADDMANRVLIEIHSKWVSPGDEAPAAYAFFIEGEIVLFHLLDWQSEPLSEDKIKVILPVPTFKIPEALKNKEEWLKGQLTESLKYKGTFRHGRQREEIQEVEVIYNQPRFVSPYLFPITNPKISGE